ncbi:MAG: hypothetical protein M1813_001346, partial [Trichoglossum hirsutum]
FYTRPCWCLFDDYYIIDIFTSPSIIHTLIKSTFVSPSNHTLIKSTSVSPSNHTPTNSTSTSFEYSLYYNPIKVNISYNLTRHKLSYHVYNAVLKSLASSSLSI